MAIDKIVAEYRLELDGLRQDVNNLKGQLKSVDDSVNKSADNTNKKLDEIGNNVGGRLPESFKRLGGAIAAAFAVERIANFAVEAVNLAAKAEGIKRAFDRLNDPTLLSRLREATKGTVSDLQLMQTAVKAANFKLPLDQLAKYLKFAQQRAVETGESIDYLVESIVLGISRKSIPILDNLGLSAQMIQDEFQKTGDFAKAVGNIIDESIGQAGETILTTAEKQAQLRAEIENTKIEIGEKLLPVIDTLLTGILNVATAFEKAFQSRDDKISGIIDNIASSGMSIEELNKQLAQNKSEIDDILSRYPNIENVNRQMLALMSKGATSERDRLDSLKRQNEGIEIYINAQKNAVKPTSKTTKEIKEQGDASKETTTQVWALGQALLGWVKLVETTKPIETAKTDTDKLADAMLRAKTELDGLIKLTPALGTTTTDTLERATETWDDYAHGLLSLFDSFNTAFTNSSNYQLATLEKQLDEGIISEEKYDRRKRDILRGEANREKAFSLLSITLATARSIMNALGSVPPNPALAAIAGVTGAVQLGVAAAAPIPAFEKGGLVKGGEKLVRINEKGEEFVINAKATRKHKDLLEAINKDNFDGYIMNVYTKQIREHQKDTAITWDDYRLMLELAKNTHQSKENTRVIVSAIKEHRKPHRF